MQTFVLSCNSQKRTKTMISQPIFIFFFKTKTEKNKNNKPMGGLNMLILKMGVLQTKCNEMQ